MEPKDDLFSTMFAPLVAAASAPPLPFVVRSADGEAFEQHGTLEAAQAVADRWNAETDPRERTHAAAYPFRGEAR